MASASTCTASSAGSSKAAHHDPPATQGRFAARVHLRPKAAARPRAGPECGWRALGLGLRRTRSRTMPQICACEKSGEWTKPLKLWASMGEDRAERTRSRTMPHISACEKSGEWTKALELLAIMGVDRIEANTITYNAAYLCLREKRRVDEGAGALTFLWRVPPASACGLRRPEREVPQEA